MSCGWSSNFSGSYFPCVFQSMPKAFASYWTEVQKVPWARGVSVKRTFQGRNVKGFSCEICSLSLWSSKSIVHSISNFSQIIATFQNVFRVQIPNIKATHIFPPLIIPCTQFLVRLNPMFIEFLFKHVSRYIVCNLQSNASEVSFNAFIIEASKQAKKIPSKHAKIDSDVL